MSLGHVALVWIVNELPLQKLPCGVRLALGFHGEGSWEAILWYFLLYFLWGYYTEILLIWLINILPKAFLPKLRGLGDNLLLPLPHWFYDNKNYKWLLPFFFYFLLFLWEISTPSELQLQQLYHHLCSVQVRFPFFL